MTDTTTIPLDNRRILIVDDTHSIHQDFHKVLLIEKGGDLSDMEAMLFGQGFSKPLYKGIDFELDSAFQGTEALELVEKAVAAQKPYAVAFVDVRMPPGWDGIQTIEHLWQADPDLQVVICTAYSDYSWQQTFARLGSNDQLLILKKPFENIEVLQIANALVYKWNSTRQARMKLGQLEAQVLQRTQETRTQNLQLAEKIRELEQTREQLLQSEKLASIGQLAAGIAHEINNPMGYVHANLEVLSGYIESLSTFVKSSQEMTHTLIAQTKEAESTAQAKALETQAQELEVAYILDDMPVLIKEALEGTARVKEIVADLTDYSHMNQQSIAEEDINQLLEQAINISKNETKYHAVIVKSFVNLPPVPCRRSKILQVFLNLLLNAAQAIQAEGTIKVSTKDLADSVEITFEDTGSGIAPEHLGRVFDPFFTTKEIGSGTGLGLHICHAIITSHGGTIKAESVLGKGSTFIVTLPLVSPLSDNA